MHFRVQKCCVCWMLGHLTVLCFYIAEIVLAYVPHNASPRYWQNSLQWTILKLPARASSDLSWSTQFKSLIKLQWQFLSLVPMEVFCLSTVAYQRLATCNQYQAQEEKKHNIGRNCFDSSKKTGQPRMHKIIVACCIWELIQVNWKIQLILDTLSNRLKQCKSLLTCLIPCNGLKLLR